LICRQHDLIMKTLEKLHRNTPRHHTQCQQSCKKQNQSTKINSLFFFKSSGQFIWIHLWFSISSCVSAFFPEKLTYYCCYFYQ
jgi:hypothetical protein